MALPVAVQVYSVREDAAADLRGTLEKIKAMGYAGVEFAGLYGHAPEDVKRMCEEVGLVPISAHVPYVDMIADPKGVLSQYATIGCQFVAVPYLREEHRPDGGQFDRVIQNIEMLGKVAKELGIQLLYHNHEFEFMTINGKWRWAERSKSRFPRSERECVEENFLQKVFLKLLSKIFKKGFWYKIRRPFYFSIERSSFFGF